MFGSHVEQLTVSGNPDDLGESLSTLRSFVGMAGEQAGLETQLIHRLRLAVDEIAANIIMYGYSEAPGVVEATAAIDDLKLTITLEDTAPPYDPLERDLPDNLGDPLDTREIGGLGVFLALRNVDEFHYERAGSRNRNVFVMNRRSS